MHVTQPASLAEHGLGIGFQLVRYFLTAALVVFLIFAWLVTAPIFHCSVFLGDLLRRWEPKT